MQPTVVFLRELLSLRTLNTTKTDKYSPVDMNLTTRATKMARHTNFSILSVAIIVCQLSLSMFDYHICIFATCTIGTDTIFLLLFIRIFTKSSLQLKHSIVITATDSSCIKQQTCSFYEFGTKQLHYERIMFTARHMILM